MSFDIDDELPEEPSPPPSRSLPPTQRIAVGRDLPHSLEAEEYLLACCLIDGPDVVPRCLDLKLGGEDFYDRKHGTVFECIVDLHRRELPIDISLVAEELKKSRQLDQIGGYAFLSQVSSRIPTTAQASYFMEKVKEQALLRQIIRSAKGAVEDCYNFSGDITSFATEVREKIERVTEGTASAEQQLAACEFNQDEKIAEDRVAFRLADIPVFTGGNISAIVAPPGVGKSAVVGAIIAASNVVGTDGVDCLGFSGPNYEKLPVLHFDTEQSKGDHQKLLHRSLRRSKRDRFPSWFHSYHLTGKAAPECRHLVETAISKFGRKHAGKLGAVIIDGWADLVTNPNDEGECFPFIARMHLLAIKYAVPIIGVLHLNPGKEGKSRGHLGSHLERKAETVLQLEMDADMVTAIWATKKRGVPIRKENGPRFQWSDELGMHALVLDWKEQAAARREEKKAKKEAARPTAFKEVYSREEQVSFYPASHEAPKPRPQIFRKAHEVSKVSDKSFNRFRLEFLRDGWIEEIDGQLFRRTRDGDDWARRRPGAQPPDEQFIP